ncbi:MAG: oligosaccharide flippase family protein [Bacteroidota bacterium]
MSSFWRSVTTLISGNLLSQAISVLGLIVLARLYLPDAYGVFGFFIASVAVMVVIVNGGYEMAVMLPRDAERAHQLVLLSCRIAIGLGLVLMLLFVLFGDVFITWGQVEEMGLWYFMIPLSILLEGLAQPLQMALNRQQQYRLMSASKVVRSALTVGLSMAMGWQMSDFKGLIAGYVLGQLGYMLLSYWGYKRSAKPITLKDLWTVQRSAAKEFRDFPIYGILSGWLYTAAKHLPFFFLPRFFDASVNGQFTKAERVLNLPPVLVSMPVGRVFYREATRVAQEAPEALAGLTKRTFWQLAGLGLPVLIVIMLWGPEIFSLVVGEVWTEAGEYARWLMPWLYLTFIASPLSYLIDIKRKLKEFLWYNIFQFVVRLAALLYGGWYLSPIECMQVFGAAGAFTVAVQIGYLLWLSMNK